jgi:hypothetical protein
VLLRRPSLLAFHLGLDRVEGARLTATDAGFRPVEFATLPLPLAELSETTWLAAVIPAWTALVREQKWRGRCALVLPAMFSLTKTIALPEGIFPSRAFGRGEFPAVDDLVASHIPLPPETVIWSAIPIDVGREAVLAVAKVAVVSMWSKLFLPPWRYAKVSGACTQIARRPWSSCTKPPVSRRWCLRHLRRSGFEPFARRVTPFPVTEAWCSAKRSQRSSPRRQRYRRNRRPDGYSSAARVEIAWNFCGP